jgi:hypothetical protein
MISVHIFGLVWLPRRLYFLIKNAKAVVKPYKFRKNRDADENGVIKKALNKRKKIGFEITRSK